MLKKIVPILVILLSAWLGQDWLATERTPGFAPESTTATAATGFTAGAQVRGEGTVQRLLADDNEGSRHQRFILKLDSGKTLLIAHNIDLAPRIDSLRQGDVVQFYGQFEDNDRGGVVHWTHHDPQGYHEDGWLKHAGRTYQ